MPPEKEHKKPGPKPRLAVEDREWLSWTTQGQLAKDSGIPRVRFARLAAQAGYKFKRCPDNTLRLNPEDEAGLLEAVADNAAEDESVALTTIPALLEASAKLVETAHEQVRDLVRTIIEPQKQATEASAKLLERALGRMSELETKRDEFVKQREEMLNEQEERRLMRERFAAAEKRKDEAWSQVIKAMPMLGNQLAATVGKWMGADPATGKKMALASELMSSLTPEQIGILASPELGFVSPEQRALLLSLFPAAATPPTPPPAADESLRAELAAAEQTKPAKKKRGKS